MGELFAGPGETVVGCVVARSGYAVASADAGGEVGWVGGGVGCEVDFAEESGVFGRVSRVV